MSLMQKVSNVFPQGNVSIGYDYGYLPFLVQNNPPIGNFKTDGNFQIQLKTLPFQGSFYYSSLGTISGLNNHFTIRFDAQAYKQQLMEKLKVNELNRIKSLDSLGEMKQQLKTNLDYLFLVKDKRVKLPIDSSRYSFPDMPDFDYDLTTPKIDTPMVELPEFDENQYLDSISDEINRVKGQVQQIEGRVKELEQIQNMSQDSLVQLEMNKVKSPWMKKVNEIMSGVNRFDIGLTYPNYSEFLIARIPVRGLNLGYQKKKLFFAFTHGKTVNNIFFTNNVIQNNLNAVRNLYNFFDFNNIKDGRRVTALKIGIGEKKGSHIHMGGLYGVGQVSYQDTSMIIDAEKNLVMEIDGGLKIRESHYLSINYGRTAIQVNSINMGEESTLFNQLIDFNERTNALLGRYQIKSKLAELAFTFRWVDPYFRSFGVGFLRSDNIRYEVKYKQKIGKKLKLNTYFRRENDNLLGLYSYENVLLSYGVGISCRPTKHWMLKVDARPIALNANNEVDSLSVFNDNLILNGVVNYNNRINDTYFNATGVYSYYQLSLDEVSQVYQNININLTIENKQITNSLILNHYQTTDTSSVPLASLLQNDFLYKFKKLQMTVMLKGSLSQNSQLDFGYGGRMAYAIHKNISLSVSGEKIVVGDFYNSIYSQNLLNYPYRFSSSLIIRW